MSAHVTFYSCNWSQKQRNQDPRLTVHHKLETKLLQTLRLHPIMQFITEHIIVYWHSRGCLYCVLLLFI